MKKFLIGGALAALVVGGVAVAQAVDGTPPVGMMHGHGGMMRMLDTNNDGVISRDEAIAMVTKHFAEVDTNGDGKVTPDEMKAEHAKRRAEMAARWGGKERGEHGEGGPGHGWRHGPDGGEGPDGPGARGPGGPGGPGGMLARLDANQDGKLTRTEFDAPFDRMDANHDGVVDEAEQQAMRQMMRDHMGPPPPPPGAPTPSPSTGK